MREEDENEKPIPLIYVELNKVKKEHYEKALHQATTYLQKTNEEKSENVKECFVIVQTGL